VRHRVEGSRPHPARWQAKVLVAVLSGAVVLGASGCSDDTGASVTKATLSSRSSDPATVRAAPRSSGTGMAAPRPPRPAKSEAEAANLLRSKPVRLQIAAIGVNSSLMPLGLRSNGTMQVPPGAFPAGWYTGGPTPGELGPAVIAGHVDTRGPGVFYRLQQVRPGDLVNVTRADGSKPVFRVKRVRQFPKNQFPTRLVYGNVDHAALRLITCGGSFNSQSGHYDDNIVVFADLVQPPG
jgi:hypothetical protein